LGPLLYFYYQEGSFGAMAGVGVLITLVSVVLVVGTRVFVRGEAVG
jgi:hypothetical protein